jgi:hypothetical protein
MHREQVLAQKKADYWADPEKFKAESKAARKADPEKHWDRAHRLRMKKPWQHLLCGARDRAKTKGIEFTLTKEWALATYTGRCAVTGYPFELRPFRGKTGARSLSPSIDRIDPDKGYTPDNCRFVLWAVNAFKFTSSDVEMVELAQAIVAGALRKGKAPC